MTTPRYDPMDYAMARMQMDAAMARSERAMQAPPMAPMPPMPGATSLPRYGQQRQPTPPIQGSMAPPMNPAAPIIADPSFRDMGTPTARYAGQDPKLKSKSRHPDNSPWVGAMMHPLTQIGLQLMSAGYRGNMNGGDPFAGIAAGGRAAYESALMRERNRIFAEQLEDQQRRYEESKPFLEAFREAQMNDWRRRGLLGAVESSGGG